jgi:hypothetical protein
MLRQADWPQKQPVGQKKSLMSLSQTPQDIKSRQIDTTHVSSALRSAYLDSGSSKLPKSVSEDFELVVTKSTKENPPQWCERPVRVPADGVGIMGVSLNT